MGWLILAIALVLIYFFVWAMVKVAGDADRKTEEMFYREKEWNDDDDWVGLSD